tara:strand:+ start:290 stop:646 length:357 start_codon:yes stop_codon:yes gene_type:complete
MNKNEEENMRIYREQNNKINLFQQKDYNDVSYWMLDNLIFPAKTHKKFIWSDMIVIEMKRRIKMLINSKSQEKLFEKISKKKYSKDNIADILRKLGVNVLEKIYVELIKNDKPKTNKV